MERFKMFAHFWKTLLEFGFNLIISSVNMSSIVDLMTNSYTRNRYFYIAIFVSHFYFALYFLEVPWAE